MEKNIIILLIFGALITIFLVFFDIYLAGIVCILVVVIVMSVAIMQDSRGVPDIGATLRADAKAVILTNKGNARAMKIHATLVPINIESDIPELEVESAYEIPLRTMVEQMKIMVTYENEEGRQFSHSSHLSAMEEEPDLLKPVFPLFRWKK